MLWSCPAKVESTYWPSGETCDMKPTRDCPTRMSVFQETMSSFRMDICFRIGTTAYRPLSFLGPSTSMPIVLPSAENEWQLAQVCRSCITTRLSGWLTSRRRQLMRYSEAGARGWMKFFSPSHGICRGGERDAPPGNRAVWSTVAEAGDRYGGMALYGVLLDCGPRGRVGCPSVRGRLFFSQWPRVVSWP